MGAFIVFALQLLAAFAVGLAVLLLVAYPLSHLI